MEIENNNINPQDMDKINAMFSNDKRVNIVNTKYQYSYVGMEEVMNNPEEYIIPELQQACKKLWDMNIFTFMVSNREDGGNTYIILEKLSEKNEKIFKKLMKESPNNYIFDDYRNSLAIKFFTENISEQKIARMFDMAIKHFAPQDVQKPFYLTEKEFLINCGCNKKIPNPDFVEPGPMPSNGNIQEFNEWLKKTEIPETITIFDKSKVTKSIKEYLKEKNVLSCYDPATKRIYSSELFLKKHLDYVKKHNETNAEENEESISLNN